MCIPTTPRRHYSVHILALEASSLFLSLSVAIYCIFLIFLTYSSTATRCRMIKQIDSGHDCRIPRERDHIEDCWPSLRSLRLVIDRFVVAHLLGWLVKALLIPDRVVLWVTSVGFELLEWMLSDSIPTFRECWWDRWVLDVLICNLIGIELGCRVRAHRKRETSRRNIEFCCPVAREWMGLGRGLVVIAALLLTDLNGFLLKDELHIHSSSPLNVYRLVGYAALALPALRQLNPEPQDMKRTDRHNKHFCFLFVGSLCCELTTILFALRTS